MAKAPDFRSRTPISFVRDHALAGCFALIVAAVVVVVAWERDPGLAGSASVVCAGLGIAFMALRFIPTGFGESLVIGGMVLGAISIFQQPPVFFEASPAPAPASPPAQAGPRVYRSAPPILIDDASGCEWIGETWSRATPRIGPDGATICNGKSTGKAPATRP